MRVEFLVRGKKAKASFESASLPEGVKCTPGTYKAKGGELYFFSFETEGNALASAARLACVRDSLPASQNVKLLEDGASAKFGENLYSLFSDFERRLREAFIIATCAIKGNFDAKSVKGVEDADLKEFETKLFFDHEFRNKVVAIGSNNLLSRDDIVDQVAALVEHTPWDALFDEGDMPTLRSCFKEIRDRRNDVMHFHRMSFDTYRNTKVLLKKVNAEIDDCIERMRADVDYPKKRADNAWEAVHIIDANDAAVAEARMRGFADAYSAMIERYASLSGASGLSASVADTVNLAGLGAPVASLANMETLAALASNSNFAKTANKMAADWQERYGKLVSAAVTPKMGHVIAQLDTETWREAQNKMLESIEPSLKQIQGASASMIEAANSSFIVGMNYGALFGSVEDGGLDDSDDDDGSGLNEPGSSLADDFGANEGQ